MAPVLDYQPHGPSNPEQHKIGLIGCGSISAYHLQAARAWGVEVVAMADPDRKAAEKRRDEYFPNAVLYSNHHDLLEHDGITMVDIATHTHIRADQIRDSINAGKHVLSQKPFVADLRIGRELVDLAKNRDVKLAVNQNGRWAPQFAALHAAVGQGLMGEIYSLDMVMEWDHTWVRGTKFEEVPDLILGDYAIHWFDAAATVFGDRKAKSVFAFAAKAPGQDLNEPMLGNTLVNFGDGLATLGFSGYETRSEKEYLCCVGSKGTFRGLGDINRITRVELTTDAGSFEYDLEGKWFPDGFRGTLGEFLRAIEDDREPSISAENNLWSLELCFAAIASAATGRAVTPGDVFA